MREVTMADVQAELEKIGEKAGASVAELRAEVRDLAREGAARPNRGGIGGEQKSLASIVAADEGFKMLASGRIKSTAIQLPPTAIHGPQAAALVSAPGLTGVDRREDIVVPAMRRLTIRDLLPVINTRAGSIEYVRESGYTNAAAVVAEGALKPETMLTLESVTASVVTIATWVSASKQILSDNSRLGLYLDTRLRHGVRQSEEVQLLYGNGTGSNLLGLAVGATAYVAPITITSPTRIDMLRLAIGQLENAGYNATGIVLHPNDWAGIELTKTTDGDYLGVNPHVSNVRTLWGRPVVVSTAMMVDKFLVGDFRTAAVLYDREDPVLDVGTVDDQFIRNLVTLRMEERISLALQLPGALITGDFGLVA